MPPVVSSPPPTRAIDFANLGYAADDAGPALEQWLRDRLPEVPVDESSRRVVAALRDSVRAVFDGCIDDRMPHVLDAVDVLNQASSASPISPLLVVTPEGTRSVTTAQVITDVSGTMAEISRSAIDLVTTFADRLRRCDGPDCGRYFLRDRTHRTWCSLGCGNRARVARHYAQHAGARSAGRTA